MANLAKNQLDTRTFAQICAGLSSSEWILIRDRIVEKTEKTEQAVYKWKDGKCIPMSIPERKAIAEIINRVLKMEKPCARDPRSPVPLTLAVQNSLTL